MARRIETCFVDGPAGRLEALLEEPEDREPVEAALICHPHPLHGGTMHNKVVYRVARGLRRAGCVVLRFNFRGVNLSQGTHDRGVGEVEDARAALGFLRERYPTLPYLVAGFSFGSRVALTLGCGLPDVTRIVVVGFPTSYSIPESYTTCRARKQFIHSTNDAHGPRFELEQFYAAFPEPKELHWVEAQDHFFAGALDEFERVVQSLSR